MIVVVLFAATVATLLVFGGGMLNEMRKANRTIDEQNELIKNQWIALSVLRQQQQPRADREHK